MRNLSIASRMLLVTFVPAMLAAIFMGAFAVVVGVRDNDRAEVERAFSLAEGLARAGEFALATANTQLLDEIAQPVLSNRSIQHVRFLDDTNTLLHSSSVSSSPANEISSWALEFRRWVSPMPLISHISVPVTRTDLTDYEEPFFDSQPESTPLAGTRDMAPMLVGRVDLTVDLSAAYVRQLDLAWRVVGWVCLVLLVALAAAYRLSQSIVKPIRKLTRSVRALAEHDTVEVPDMAIGGELEELAGGVRFLSSELQAFHSQQREAIRLATKDLQQTLSLLEQKNRELDKAREAAETASAFKSQFVANMSHEIRTPLNAIIGTLSVFSHSGLDNHQLDQMEAIKSSSSTLLYLVEDILDISRIEAGSLSIETVKVDLEKLLDEVHLTAAMQAQERGIELFIAPIPDDSLLKARTDPIRLKQVLLNLLNNSIKFTHDGHVTLKTEIVDHEHQLRVVQFSVEDTGIGIPAEKQENLFNAFTQIDMSTTRRYGGTGLGLYIAAGIVELLEGSIHLHSEEGRGTRIDVVIPMPIDSEPQSGLLPSATAPAPSGWTLLDDYQPLQNEHRLFLDQSVARIRQHHELPESVCVRNIPNKVIASLGSEFTEFPGASLTGAIDEPVENPDSLHCDIAMVTQITPDIKKRIERMGYTGYVVKTPSRAVFERALLAAVRGQAFQDNIYGDNRALKSDPSTQKLVVLAVDDQKINIDLLMQYFDYLNVRGLYARSGKAALACVECEKLDLVLLDLHMPEQDGFEVVSAIRRSKGVNAGVPVIAMTADAYPATRKQALAEGFDALLTKPATVQQVSQVLDYWTAERDSTDKLRPNRLVSIEACASAVSGDIDWARGALRTYAEEVPGHVRALQDGVMQQDRNAVYEVAHAVKGVSRLFQIEPVADAALLLEQACRDGEWSAIVGRAEQLEKLLHLAADECNAIEA